MRYNRTSKQVLISVAIAVAFVALALMTGTRRASAATFTVINLDDNGAGSLRDAINQANAMAGADTINFQAGLTGTITLSSALPQITGNLTITGPGAGVMTVSGNSSFRVFSIAFTGTASISGLTISNGRASDFGGGIFNAGTLTVTSSILSGNSATSGGGIRNNGSLVVIASNVSGNSATIVGGGIYNGGTLTITSSTVSGNSATGGAGGIDNSGILTITGSTVSGNSATSGNGGGIRNDSDPFSVVMLTVTNSTISGNSATSNGGGIHNGGTLSITGSTFSGNSAILGGAIANSGSPTAAATVKNSIIANGPSGANCSGLPITAVGANFSTDDSCPDFMLVTPEQLKLGPLQPNGGLTLTHGLLAGSVAIDSVTDCTDVAGNLVTTDQRGVTRPKGLACDAGAFEICAITCPQNSTTSSIPGQCSAVVDYTSATADAICGAVSCSPASGSSFPVGTTTVTCTATDASGNTASCTFTITVNDTQAPSITCPANITVSTAPNQCSTVVNYSAPTVSDNCSGVGAPSCLPASGSTFAVGTTTVTCTATDVSGNTSSCSFTVTVNDTQPPMITCPANITQSTDPNQCSAVVSYKVPTPTDNCPGVTATCVPASGSTFPKGITTVTCNVSDASGNTASCSFTITVNDTQPPTITCPTNVTAVAAQTCPISSSATVTFPAPTVSDNCPGVTSVCTPPSGSIFPVGTSTVTCTATDTSGNTATCSFTVTVFSGCLQDDSNPANVVLFNAATGQYRFCCGGTIFTGVGTVLVKGCILTIQHYPADRRVLIKFDGSVGAGTASLQSPPGTIRCTIMDRNTRNNTCACQ